MNTLFVSVLNQGEPLPCYRGEIRNEQGDVLFWRESCQGHHLADLAGLFVHYDMARPWWTKERVLSFIESITLGEEEDSWPGFAEMDDQTTNQGG